MRIKYAIQRYSSCWYDVDGELLHDLAPHIAHVATFALGRDPVTGEFVVTNLETGTRAAIELHRGAAIDSARERLSTKTEGDIALAYRRAVRNHAQLRAEMNGR